MKNQPPSITSAPPRPLLGGNGERRDGDRFSNSLESGQRFLRRIVLLDIALDRARQEASKTNITSWGCQ
jgi:hypothetical protein